MTELSLQEQHQELIKAINNLYPESLKVQKKYVETKNINKVYTPNEISDLAIVVSRILNFHGASVNDINLYGLFNSYFLDEEKRKTINSII